MPFDLAGRLHREVRMTRTAKICGAVAGTLFIYLLLVPAINFNPAREYSDSIRHLPSHLTTNTPSGRSHHFLPTVFFWAWEKPEDLQFVNSEIAGVAFLAKTIYLFPRYQTSTDNPSDEIVVRPRLQPLRVAPGTPLIAVARLEISQRSTPRPGEAVPSAANITAILASKREEIAKEIVELQFQPGVRAVQIDFDATVSQRSFYSSLLSDVRRNLPASLPLSITALASWCIGDSWLEHLPPGTIDEAVPMLFRMGPDTATVARFLRSGQEFPASACQGSLGLSTDESLSQQVLTRKLVGVPSSWRSKRIYVFSPRLWTPTAATLVLKEWQQ